MREALKDPGRIRAKNGADVSKASAPFFMLLYGGSVVCEYELIILDINLDRMVAIDLLCQNVF